MREYFKRLKDHPGVGYAFAFTIMGAMAGAQNKSGPPLTGALFGGLLMGVIVWSMVLISNSGRK